MKCLRCGVEIEEGQVFCPDCLADMERHPVTPGTVVYIPKPREPQPQRRAPKRRTPEEQIRLLKLRIRVLQIFLAIFIGLALLFVNPAIRYFQDEQTFLPGQNYSSYSTDDTIWN